MRSEERARTNSVAVRRATSSRLAGEKSSASMLLEISRARTIEIPSLRSSARADPRRGPAERGTHVAHRRAGETGEPLPAPPPPQWQSEEQQEQYRPRERHRRPPLALNSRASARARETSGATSTPCAVANAT